jgi:hypothetical protein
LVFEKNANFLQKIGKKSQKIVIITSTPSVVALKTESEAVITLTITIEASFQFTCLGDATKVSSFVCPGGVVCIVVIVSAKGREDGGFESRRCVRLLGL